MKKIVIKIIQEQRTVAVYYFYIHCFDNFRNFENNCFLICKHCFPIQNAAHLLNLKQNFEIL